MALTIIYMGIVLKKATPTQILFIGN